MVDSDRREGETGRTGCDRLSSIGTAASSRWGSKGERERAEDERRERPRINPIICIRHDLHFSQGDNLRHG